MPPMPPLATPPAEILAACDRIAPTFASASPGDIKPRRLTELPAANLTLALYRRIDGCSVPIVVRYGLGANARYR